MSIAAWPSTLPCFLADGYNYKRFNNIELTEFGNGYARSRRKPNGLTEFNGALRVTGEQLESLESWVNNELKDVGWFYMPLKTGSEIKYLRVRLKNKDFAPKLQSKSRWYLVLTLQSNQQEYLTAFELYEQLFGITRTFGTDTKNALNALWD